MSVLTVKVPRAMTLGALMIQTKEAGLDPDKLMYMGKFWASPHPSSLKIGTMVEIDQNGYRSSGIVQSAINYGSEDDPNWYIELGCGYWKQELDGGEITVILLHPEDAQILKEVG